MSNQASDMGYKLSLCHYPQGFFVRAMVFIKQKENKGQTIIGINGGMDPFAAALFGFIFHYVLRGDFLSQIQEAIENGIKEKYNVSTIS